MRTGLRAWTMVGLISLAPCAFSRADTYVEEGLVSYWRFDEGSGRKAKDSAGANDGSIVGVGWVDGVRGKALRFDGADDHVTCGNDIISDFDKGDFTAADPSFSAFDNSKAQEYRTRIASYIMELGELLE